MIEAPIRYRQTSDLDSCVAALALVHHSDGYPANWPADPARWLTPTGMLRSWVAVSGEATVVGHVMLQNGAGRVASVRRLFVAPGARGHGLGARLLEHARQWAVAHELNLILEVADSERSAIALYERTGWQRVETVQADWTRPGGGPMMLHRYTVQGVDKGHFELS